MLIAFFGLVIGGMLGRFYHKTVWAAATGFGLCLAFATFNGTAYQTYDDVVSAAEVFPVSEETIMEYTSGGYGSLDGMVVGMFAKTKVAGQRRIGYEYFMRDPLGKMSLYDNWDISGFREESRMDGALQTICRRYILDAPNWLWSVSLDFVESRCRQELVVPTGRMQIERFH